MALGKQMDFKGAAKAFQKLLEIDSHNPNPVDLANLGAALFMQNDISGAITHLQKAIEIDRKNYKAQYTLGLALQVKKDWGKAVAQFQVAIQLKPKAYLPYMKLGQTLLLQGEYGKALVALNNAKELVVLNLPHFERITTMKMECQRLMRLDKKLGAILKGDQAPAGTMLEVANYCLAIKKRYRDAVRIYEAVFADEPNRANQIDDFYRCNAALAAVLAAGTSNQKESAAYRKKALEWLTADLAARNKRLQTDPLTALTMVYMDNIGDVGIADLLDRWQHLPGFASVRDGEHLAKLPIEEQLKWHKLWTDVERIRLLASARYVETRRKAFKKATGGDLPFPGTTERPFYWTKMVAGKTYHIFLLSSQLKPRLRITNSKGNSVGPLHNPIGPFWYSKVVFSPKHDGTYGVVAGSMYPSEMGSFTIIIREMLPIRQSKK